MLLVINFAILVHTIHEIIMKAREEYYALTRLTLNTCILFQLLGQFVCAGLLCFSYTR